MAQLTYRQALYAALHEEMTRDPNIILLGEDVGQFGGAFGVSGDLLHQFGAWRVLDTPISESGFVGAAVGAALMGMRPVVEIMFADFLTVAADALINQLAKVSYMSGGKVSAPVVVRVTTGAPGSAAAQHSQSAEAWLMNIPGLKLITPTTPADAKGLLKTAIRGADPVIFFEHKRLYDTLGDVPTGEQLIPFGEGRIVRAGRDVTVVSISGMLPDVLTAADQLEQAGISVEVIDPRCLVPFDLPLLLDSVAKTSRLVIVHEGHQRGGVGAEIAALVAEHGLDRLDAPIIRVAAANIPIPYSPPLEKAVLPSVKDIIEGVQRVIGS
jgi:pyruvate dehydrogenase E1 component beta subunit